MLSGLVDPELRRCGREYSVRGRKMVEVGMEARKYGTEASRIV